MEKRKGFKRKEDETKWKRKKMGKKEERGCKRKDDEKKWKRKEKWEKRKEGDSKGR